MVCVMSESPTKKATEPAGIGEDWLAAALGLLIVALALLSLNGPHLLGWVVTARVWTDIATALAPVSATYASLGGAGSLLLTWLVLLAVLCVGAALLKIDVRRFALAFTVVFWIGYGCWIVGSQANLAVNTPADAAKFGVHWSLNLTAEGGYIVALVAGLVISNFLPRFAQWLSVAIRPELYIKTAIVILGAFVAVSAAERASFAASLVLRAWPPSSRRISSTGRSCTTSHDAGSGSRANGRRHWHPASPSAA